MGKGDPTGENLAKLFAIWVFGTALHWVYLSLRDVSTWSEYWFSLAGSAVFLFIVVLYVAFKWGMLGKDYYED